MHLQPRIAAERLDMNAHPDSAKILAALPLRQRPDLYVDAGTDESGHLLILEASSDPEDDSEGIIGLAVRDDDGWYLGCITCLQVIKEADSGMCRGCREDADYQDRIACADPMEDW
jgi:hypothetical protein